MALVACSDSGTASTNKDEGDSSGTGGNSQGSVATNRSSGVDNAGSSSSNGGIFDNLDYGTITVEIDGKNFTVDSVTAVAPYDFGSDTGLVGTLSNTMYITAMQKNTGLDESELMISVKDPKVGENIPGGLTSLDLVYSEDSTRMWLKADGSTVTITSIDKSGTKGSYDLTLNEICFMCEPDSVLHVTGTFDINFEP